MFGDEMMKGPVWSRSYVSYIYVDRFWAYKYFILSIIAEELGGTNERRSKEASGGFEILREGEMTTKKGVGSTEGECCIHA